ncbi:MAG: (2Fe-2S)-binding protein [Planctomycetaceae bacterium]|nr:(2Fe-2S)-binding protein [Planctomycetaceae bacterium]MCP4478495.1 (2Fe-2S)-binding protein [Planctomycetaceae bacterium]MCP4775298.1 (2Fe-2S)-binding protein [Planctomycetaceae bacterium]
MKPDDPVCLCFHVTRRKVVNFIRIEKPSRPSQLSQCFGAGTGCGWCRKYLERLLEQEKSKATNATNADKTERSATGTPEVSFQEYARQRAKYVEDGHGTPPPNAG